MKPCQLRQEQEIVISGSKIETLDRQDISPGQERSSPGSDIESLKQEHLLDRVFPRRAGVPPQGLRRVTVRDLGSIKPGDESIVVLHSQGQGVEQVRILNLEGDPQVS